MSRKKNNAGHNVNQVVEVGKLRSFVERIEKLEEQKSATNDDIKVVYAEVKSSGFDPKIVRRCVRERQIPDIELREYNEILSLYRDALGILADTPLGRASEPHGKAGHA